jgi:hypothetical protein
MYDSELRCIIWDRENKSKGIQVPTDLNILVKKVVVCPKTSNFVKDAVRNVISQYGFDWNVQSSSLDETPPY